MTDEEINITIAGIIGMSREAIELRLDWELAQQQYQHGTIPVEEFYSRHLRVDKVPMAIPNYCGDLNLMHEVERLIPETQWGRHNAQLFRAAAWIDLSSGVNRPESIHLALRADAHHRAEAFLKTIGKWVEDGFWWCESHNRKVTHTDQFGNRCCDPKLPGIMIQCKAVFRTE